MNEKMIAPCGMNCTLCISYQAKENDINKQGFNRRYCPGCIIRGKNCTFMKKHCVYITKGKYRFCYECADFPCTRLVALDKRYRLGYNMSMIDNLRYIQEKGMDFFLQDQEKKWSCDVCGGTICCHNGLCMSCELELLKANKTLKKREKKDERSK